MGAVSLCAWRAGPACEGRLCQGPRLPCASLWLAPRSVAPMLSGSCVVGRPLPVLPARPFVVRWWKRWPRLASDWPNGRRRPFARQ
ncbi:unnamed protein product [Amoebophrya sp. A120]|nr:unnamed protein product [Amoebophrya sp. A120]|eukprot:GSA120T00014343001.1